MRLAGHDPSLDGREAPLAVQSTHRAEPGFGGVAGVIVERDAKERISRCRVAVMVCASAGGRTLRDSRRLDPVSNQVLEVNAHAMEQVGAAAADERLHGRGRGVLARFQQRQRQRQRLRRLSRHRLRGQSPHLAVAARERGDERFGERRPLVAGRRPPYRLPERFPPHLGVIVAKARDHPGCGGRHIGLELGEAPYGLQANAGVAVLEPVDHGGPAADEGRRPHRCSTPHRVDRVPEPMQQHA